MGCKWSEVVLNCWLSFTKKKVISKQVLTWCRLLGKTKSNQKAEAPLHQGFCLDPNYPKFTSIKNQKWQKTQDLRCSNMFQAKSLEQLTQPMSKHLYYVVASMKLPVRPTWQGHFEAGNLAQCEKHMKRNSVHRMYRSSSSSILKLNATSTSKLKECQKNTRAKDATYHKLQGKNTWTNHQHHDKRHKHQNIQKNIQSSNTQTSLKQQVKQHLDKQLK